MSEIDALKHRISAALERITQGVEALPTTVAAPAVDHSSVDHEELERLQADLERLASENIALTKQVEHLETAKAEAEARTDVARAEAQTSYQHQMTAVSRFDGELQSLREANRQLRTNNQALRDANAAGVGEPHLINKGLMAELDALRADRAAEEAEAGAILGELKNVLDYQTGASADAETSEAM
ncbi:hypothetical protein [Roseovarius sp. EL26]|uniref:hypothetical protein n=1 Tax=Roseovarius sp. EL26 TaxID=2126672 RepID=UPI000EA364B1|nr:hypothetical protein [Roseovarius sp. EL26]